MPDDVGTPNNPRVIKPKTPKELWDERMHRREWDRADPLGNALERRKLRPLPRSPEGFGKPKPGEASLDNQMYREDI